MVCEVCRGACPARAGTVTEIRDQYGDDDPAGGHENGVFVLHDDGTVAIYLHMAEDGVLVDVGDTVEVGQVVGLVGTSGTDVAHPSLHMSKMSPSAPPPR